MSKGDPILRRAMLAGAAAIGLGMLGGLVLPAPADATTLEDARAAGYIRVGFANEAPFRQAYPVIQLSFFDMRDQAVARRSFVPAEYLPHGLDPTAGMAAGSAVQATLEIVDPGTNAVNFTFEFH